MPCQVPYRPRTGIIVGGFGPIIGIILVPSRARIYGVPTWAPPFTSFPSGRRSSPPPGPQVRRPPPSPFPMDP